MFPSLLSGPFLCNYLFLIESLDIYQGSAPEDLHTHARASGPGFLTLEPWGLSSGSKVVTSGS